jgi:hypothetical protein
MHAMFLRTKGAGLHPTQRKRVATVQELEIAVADRRVFHTSTGVREQSAVSGSSS